jgi:heme A synthase
LVLAQVALGAAFRHKALGLMPHIIGAMVVSAAIMTISAFVLHQFPEHPSLRKSAIVLMSVTGVQVFLGIFAYLTRAQAAQNPLIMVIVTVAHVAAGALTLASTIALSILILRNVRSHATAPHHKEAFS